MSKYMKLNEKVFKQRHEQARQEWHETKQQMEWLIKHRFKIWAIYVVCLALILWIVVS